MDVIKAVNLRKSYKKVAVLKGVSFTVERGTVFALLGANGAGKTTAINILTTLLPADGGTAQVSGFDIAKDPGKVRESISLTGQFAAVDGVLTARENLVLIGNLRHIEDPERTAKRLLEQFDLTGAADRRVGTFSGGMVRRLDIAMSLIGNPAIIFFDEPTTGLDPESRTMMWQQIRALATSGTTVFLTTQYLEEADQLADKIAILAEGKIVAEGTADGLKKLLPQGRIEFTFHDGEQLNRAATLLKNYDVAREDGAFSLTITTDGSAAGVARIFTQIEAAHLEVAEFAQKQPTLDDVFLKVINENKEKSNA